MDLFAAPAGFIRGAGRDLQIGIEEHMKIWKHFVTVTRHRNMVLKHCIKAGIIWQGLRHDLSKYSPSEFIPGAKFYQGTCSPQVKEREVYGYSEAWMHHQGRNKHHFEYWVDYDPVDHVRKPVKMPLRYVKEMFCDRVAASKIYNGKDYEQSQPYAYYMRGVKAREIHPETAALLEKMLRMLKEKGEEETFRYIRNLKEEDYES